MILDFEKPLLALEEKIRELRSLSENGTLNIAAEVQRLEKTLHKQLRQVYARLTPWQQTQVARHPGRPRFSDFRKILLEDFVALGGDRRFGEDAAIVGGLCRFRGYGVVALGQEKGKDIESRLRHNFGMARPEGYRKACRLMRLAEHFSLPVLTFVDTSGAYPGVDAEERGQSEAIASSISTCLDVRTPLLAAVIGEGGSGGAIALASADRVCMLQHAIYSVISPEGCASILWRSAEHAAEAAESLCLTSTDMHRLGIVESVIPEPLGGAHRNPEAAVQALGDWIEKQLDLLTRMDGESLWAQRRSRFLDMTL